MLKFSLEGRPFVLRSLVQTDVDKYRLFFNELSEESIRCRFGHLLAKLTGDEAAQRTKRTSEGEMALVILDGQQDQIVAVGRCYSDRPTAKAEIALVVSESMRRLGLGRFLLAQLIQIARDEKTRLIEAFISTQNTPILRLLQSAGFLLQPVKNGDDQKLVLDVSS